MDTYEKISENKLRIISTLEKISDMTYEDLLRERDGVLQRKQDQIDECDELLIEINTKISEAIKLGLKTISDIERVK